MNRRYQEGAGNVWLILTAVFATTTIVAAGFLVWALMNYFDQKNNVDSKVSVAVAAAVKEQAEKDAAIFEAEEKKPNRKFVGPDDYGRLMFDYPKTWSLYVDAEPETAGSRYVAYLNPEAVPPIKSDTKLALRVLIETRDYDSVLATYDARIKSGALKTSTINADGVTGTRLEGLFTKDLRAIAVIFKIRDKTVTLQTDAETFRGDFDAIVNSITFNK